MVFLPRHQQNRRRVQPQAGQIKRARGVTLMAETPLWRLPEQHHRAGDCSLDRLRSRRELPLPQFREALARYIWLRPDPRLRLCQRLAGVRPPPERDRPGPCFVQSRRRDRADRVNQVGTNLRPRSTATTSTGRFAPPGFEPQSSNCFSAPKRAVSWVGLEGRAKDAVFYCRAALST